MGSRLTGYLGMTELLIGIAVLPGIAIGEGKKSVNTYQCLCERALKLDNWLLQPKPELQFA